MITIEKKKLKDATSCTFCSRGLLKIRGIGLNYPYKIVYEISGNSLVITMCSECLKIIKQFKG